MSQSALTNCAVGAAIGGLADDFGGVECFKTSELSLGQTHRSRGMLVPDEALGGIPADLEFNGFHLDVVTHAVVSAAGVIGPSQVLRFAPGPGAIFAGRVFKMYESKTMIPDIAWVSNNDCTLVADREHSKLACVRVPGEIPWEVPSVDAPPSSLAIY